MSASQAEVIAVGRQIVGPLQHHGLEQLEGRHDGQVGEEAALVGDALVLALAA